MPFNTAEIMTSRHGACKYDEVTIDLKNADVELPDIYHVTEPTDQAPLYELVYRRAFGYHLEPADKPTGMVGPMFDGAYARIDYKVKELLSKKLGYPCPEVIMVHDRFETQEQYDFLCR
jgi:hypothetical protein